MVYVYALNVSPWRVLAVAAGAALAAWLAVGAAARMKRRPRPPLTAAQTVWVLAAAYVVVFATWSVARHYAMSTCAFDLGFYANAIYQFGHGHPFQVTVAPGAIYSQPCTPALAALAPLTRVFRDPTYLLVLQAAFLAAGVVLVFFIARPPEGSAWPAAALAAAFAFSPLLHGANLYDFHPRALGLPLALAAFYFFSRRRFGPGVACAVLLALTREDMAIHAVPLALWGGWATGRKKAGVIAAVGLALYAVIFVFTLYPGLTFARDVAPLDSWFITRHLSFFHAAAPAAERFTAADVTAKVGYLVAVAGPTAAFFPAAGATLLTVITPLAFPAITSLRPMYQLGLQYPLALLPFVFGAAAVGLRRLRAPGASPARRRWAAVAATAALLFTLGQIGLFARGYYGPTARMAIPSPHDKALAGVVGRVPPGICIAADDPFLAHLAHRRYAYYYGYMAGAVLAATPEALILERRHHPPADLPLLAKDARAWGLTLAAADGDHAYLYRGPAKATWAELFRKWYGTLEEWQCTPAEPDRSIRDPLAYDGRALPPAREIYCDPGPRYVFPPGEYNLAFVLRAAGGKAARANLSATAVSVENHEQKRTAVATAELAAGAPYTSTNVHLKFERPFSLTFFIGADEPICYDAVSINGPAYTFKNVAKTAVQVNLGLIPAY